jgi:hypothetical protein
LELLKTGKTAKDEEIPEIINKILNDTNSEMFKHIIPLTNGILRLQSLQENGKLLI